MRNFLTAVLLFSSFAATEANAEIRSADQRKSSYQTLLRQGAYDKNIVFTYACQMAMKNIYVAGGTLASKELRARTYPLSEETYTSGIHPGKFFHYTDSEEMTTAITVANKMGTEGFDEFLSYSRLNPSGGKSWNTVFYIAEDPVSSKSFGRRQVQLTLNQNARVLKVTPELWERAYNEVTARFPALAGACPMLSGSQHTTARGWPGYGTGEKVYSELYFAMAEDSGVDLINYVLGGGRSCQSLCGNWYQMLNTTTINSVEIH